MTDDPVSRLQLEEQAHIWFVRPDEIHDAEALERFHALLGASEHERHARLRFAAHRRLFLVSHAMARSVLSYYSETPPADWRFDEGPYGRPEIVREQNPHRLRFNLSHTEQLATCLVCLERDCGIDVERLNRVGNLDGVVRRVFSEPERADLAQREGEDLQGRFTQYWTLKEAYMKARGMGFQLPPRSFTVVPGADHQGSARLDVPASFDDEAGAWQLESHSLDAWHLADYRLGVALRRDPECELTTVVRPWRPADV